MRVVELFGGIGAWSKALSRLDANFEIVDVIEIDKKTIKSYNYIHKTNFAERDIRDVNEDYMPDFDVLLYSPPCQSWSVGGDKKGFDDERGAVFFDALRIISAKKPKIAVMENVSHLTTKKFQFEYNQILKELEMVGYKNYVKVVDALDHNFPQSRQRVFIISIRNDIKYEYKFPEKEALTKRFVDYLVDDYDGHLHSEKGVAYMNRKSTRGRTHWDFAHHSDTNMQWCRCITANFQKGVPYNVLIDRRHGEVIRKFTSLEVMRLMGFDDADWKALKDNGISDTQIYIMAGNSIVVDVLEKILKNVIHIVDK